MKPFTLFLAVGSLLWASGVPLARAQTPNVTAPAAMSYQGRLVNASGAALPDGTGYEVEVRLWSAPTGGTLVWGARYGGVAVKAGAFNLVLGAAGGAAIAGATTTDLKAAFAAPERYLGLTVTRDAQAAALAGAAEVLPRQQLLSAPYALRSETAGAADQNAVTSLSIKDGDIKSIDIGTGEVKTANLADQAITSAKIADGTIQTANVAIQGIAVDRLASDYAVFWEEQPGATPGGPGLTNWTRRILNQSTVTTLATSSISRAGNTITLQPGIYLIRAAAPTYAMGRTQLVLRDVTGNPPTPVVALRGSSEYSADRTVTSSTIENYLTVSGGARQYEVWQYCSSIDSATTRLGVDSGTPGPADAPDRSIYTRIHIQRVK